MQTFLVTGATGYLGRHLVQALLNQGQQVCALKRHSSTLPRFDDTAGQLIWIDIDQLEQVFQLYPIDCICHAATSYGRQGQSVADIAAVNIQLGIQLLALAQQHQVACWLNIGTALPETASDYALCKKTFSQFANNYCEMHGQLQFIDCQLEHFYGPNDHAYKLIGFLVDAFSKNLSEIALTSGEQVRDFIYIDDVIAALLCIVQHRSQLPLLQTISVGSGEGILLKSFINQIKQRFAASTQLKFGELPYRPNEPMHMVADIGLLQTLGWQPKVALSQGIEYLYLSATTAVD